MNVRRGLGWLAGLGVALVAACSADGDRSLSYLCGYDFELSVREGPSAGLVIQGPFSLVQSPDGAYEGALLDSKTSRYFAVTGTTTAGAGELRFTSPEGDVIVGQGPPLGNFAEACPRSLDGVLTGPNEGDSGDWQSRCCVQTVDATAAAVCDACLASGSRPGLCENCIVCAFQCGGGGSTLQERYGVEMVR